MSRLTSRVAVPGVLFLGCLCVGCGRVAEQPDASGAGAAYGDYVIGEPMRYENLTVFPVTSKERRDDDRFMTLDEGLKSGTVEIREMGGGRLGANPAANANDAAAPQPRPAPPQQSARENGPPEASPAQQQAAAADQDGSPDVNQLLVINRSSKPLYLMPGEVIIGGQQDRAIGQEILVEATGKPTPIEVFCVEHGRWNGRDVAENVNYLSTVQAGAGEQLSREQLQKLAEEANNGKFVRSAGVVSKDVRLAVQGGGGQGGVWDEVSKANAKLGTKSDSGAFTANYGDEQITARLNPYIDALQKPVAESQNVVGVIVAVNGKPQSVDVFESTPLFRKLWPKLLKNYALDALAQSPAIEAEAKLAQIDDHLDLDGEEIGRLRGKAAAELAQQVDCACDISAALAFFKETHEAQVAKTDSNGAVSITRRETDRIFSASASAPSDIGGGFGGGGGGFGGAVHSVGIAK